MGVVADAGAYVLYSAFARLADRNCRWVLYTSVAAFDSLASEAWKAHARTDLLPRMHLLGTVLTAGLMAALLPFRLVGVCAGVAAAAGVAIYAVVGAVRVTGISSRSILSEAGPTGKRLATPKAAER